MPAKRYGACSRWSAFDGSSRNTFLWRPCNLSSDDWSPVTSFDSLCSSGSDSFLHEKDLGLSAWKEKILLTMEVWKTASSLETRALRKTYYLLFEKLYQGEFGIDPQEHCIWEASFKDLAVLNTGERGLKIAENRSRAWPALSEKYLSWWSSYYGIIKNFVSPKTRWHGQVELWHFLLSAGGI